MTMGIAGQTDFAKNLDALTPGAFYRFIHSRKGEFFARFEGHVEHHGNKYVDVSIPTGDGTGQARFANSMVYTARGKRYPVWSRKHLLPGLLVSVVAPPESEQRRWRDSAEADEKDFTEAGAVEGYAVNEPSAPPAIVKTKGESLLPLLVGIPVAGTLVTGLLFLFGVI